MDNIVTNFLLLIVPELGVVTISIIVLLSGLFIKRGSPVPIYIAIILTIFLSYYYFVYCSVNLATAFFGMYIVDSTSYNMKCILLSLLSFYLLSYLGYHQSISKKYNYEYLFIVFISIFSSFIIISADNFIPLYLGVELTSICSYILAAFNKDDIKSSEAGLKYFTFGSFASCLMLFGLSFIYGVTGSLDLQEIVKYINNDSMMLSCAFILLFCGVLFKLSAFPFHFWAPDVYDGSPLLSVTLFSSILKFPSLFFAITIFSITKHLYSINSILEIVVIISLLLGSIGAIMQTSIKRLMAYSTIFNIAFALIGVILKSNSLSSAIAYIIVYSVSTIGFFTILYILLGEEAENASIYDLQGLAQLNKFGTAGIAFIMFSMIGIPPFAGFFVKYVILVDALNKQYYLLFSIALLSTLISAYYYLKIIAMLYFNKAKEVSRVVISRYSIFVATISFLFISFFSILPTKYLMNYKIFI
jgi:NADH-quinone oxidoreductase subunit N